MYENVLNLKKILNNNYNKHELNFAKNNCSFITIRSGEYDGEDVFVHSKDVQGRPLRDDDDVKIKLLNLFFGESLVVEFLLINFSFVDEYFW